MEGETNIILGGGGEKDYLGFTKAEMKVILGGGWTGMKIVMWVYQFLHQFSLNADKRNMLEEMTGQLREEVRKYKIDFPTGQLRPIQLNLV